MARAGPPPPLLPSPSDYLPPDGTLKQTCQPLSHCSCQPVLQDAASLLSAWACLHIGAVLSLHARQQVPCGAACSTVGLDAAFFTVQDACRAIDAVACSLCCTASFSSQRTAQQSAASGQRQVLRCLQDMSAEHRRQQRADTLQARRSAGCSDSHCPACAGWSRWVMMAAPRQLMLRRAASLTPLGPSLRPRAQGCSLQGLGQRRQPCAGLSCTTLSAAACCNCARHQCGQIVVGGSGGALLCTRHPALLLSRGHTEAHEAAIAYCDSWPHF